MILVLIFNNNIMNIGFGNSNSIVVTSVTSVTNKKIGQPQPPY